MPLSCFESGKTYTYAIKEKNGTLRIVNTKYGSSAGSAASKIYMEWVGSNGIGYRVNIYPGKLEWAVLCEGTYTAETLRPHAPTKYITEFVECLRYYREIKQAYFPVAIHNTSTKRFAISIPTDIPMVDNGAVATGFIVSPPKYLRANGTTYELKDLVVAETTVYNGSIRLIIQTSTDIPNAHAGFISESAFAISKDL